jgi:cell division protease FtsH
MNTRKVNLFWKFHWIKILVLLGAIVIAISLVIFLRQAIIAWSSSESYFKKAALANILTFFYVILVVQIITMPLQGFFWHWLMYRGGHFKFTGIHKKGVDANEINIRWQDVIGMEEAKQEALEVVRLVKDRAQLQRIGGKILRGILMIGPPGCGKTYLAKAIATEADMPFLAMSGSEFVEMFVGVGASRIRSLFKKARQLAYAEGGCIIFVDEMDAVGARRATDRGLGGQTEFNTTLNQLLVEMDGLKEKDYNIVVIGATNAPENFLDPALLRPGRFDRKIFVDLPNLEEREKLTEYYLKDVKYGPDIDMSRLARMTIYKTPADIANLIRESALIAVRNKKDKISMHEISEAMDRIEMGIKRKRIFSEKERQRVAIHEAGHAIVMYFCQPTADVFKASIASRGGALGMVVPHPREELRNIDRNQLLGEIKVCLGGYVAEKIKFAITDTGVAEDFKRVMRYAHDMVWRFGMGETSLVGDYTAVPQEQLAKDIVYKLNLETQQIIQNCLKETESLLKQELPLLETLSQKLLVKEELEYDEIEAIFKEAGKSRPTIS